VTSKPNNPDIVTSGGSVERMPELTPQFAAELLERLHPHQRRVRQYHVDILANAMLTGRFRWTADTIKLDADLRVIDGQHRLAAVVKSGVTLKDVLVAIIEDPEAIKNIDQGIGRSLGDLLRTHGRPMVPRTISGAIIAEHFDWANWRRRLSREEQLDLIQEFEFMDELRALRSRSPRGAYIFTVGPVSAAIACMRVNHATAIEFFNAVFSMNPIVWGEPNDQSRLLYTWLQIKPRDGKPSSERHIREGAWKALRAWNAWRRGEKLTRLVYKGSNSPMPTVEV
jgi:hypothetical protein